MKSYGKKPFPATWGDEGVDVSRDHFIKPWGKEKNPSVHVGANYKFSRDPTFGMNDNIMKNYVCKVGNCSGLIKDKPKDNTDIED